MLALEVQPGEVVIAPSITFLATANCARYVGAEVVFADVDPLSGLMTPDTLAEALGRVGDRKLRAVLPVHLRGDTVNLPELAALAGQAGAVLVEDAPHALGSTMTYGNVAERVGDARHSAMATFSFHPVKTIATGEGGMVTTNDTALAERLRAMRSHGMVRPAGSDPWIYEMPEPGFNYRLPDILCALGLSQLAKLPKFATRRRALAKAYEAALAPAGAHRPPRRAPALERPGPAPPVRADRLSGRRPHPPPGRRRPAGLRRGHPGPLYSGSHPALLPRPLRRPQPPGRGSLVRPVSFAAALPGDGG